MTPEKTALYFGCWEQAGHFMHDIHGRHVWELPKDFPWTEGLMDTGLLKNGKVPDIPDGRVFWTAGGAKAFWYAFYWWDRSVDTRGACNSGIYVRGFGHHEPRKAFEYGCAQFPNVISRQKFPLVLQNVAEPAPAPQTGICENSQGHYAATPAPQTAQQIEMPPNRKCKHCGYMHAIGMQCPGANAVFEGPASQKEKP